MSHAPTLRTADWPAASYTPIKPLAEILLTNEDCSIQTSPGDDPFFSIKYILGCRVPTNLPMLGLDGLVHWFWLAMISIKLNHGHLLT